MNLIKNPHALMAGLQDTQDEIAQENHVLLEWAEMIERKIEVQEIQLGKLIDLYISGDFAGDMLTERKTRLEDNLASLNKEHQELRAMLEKVTLTDSQMEGIQEYCDSIRDRVDTVSFDEKRQLIELFDVRGKLAIENGEKVVYVTCLLEPQPVSLALTSHLSNTGGTAIRLYACHLLAPSR